MWLCYDIDFLPSCPLQPRTSMTLSPGRPALRYITQAFAYLRGVLQPPGTVVSKVEIPHPPLFESEPPNGFRYAIPLAISFGTFMCVLITSGSTTNDLISTHPKHRGL